MNLQDAVRAYGDGASDAIPPPTAVPDPTTATASAGILPEANGAPPVSAQTAVDQLARTHYGDQFVDRYGDLLGVRPTGLGDTLRNVSTILSTQNPNAVSDMVWRGAQLREGLQAAQLDEAAKKRKDLIDLYSATPKLIGSGMDRKAVRTLFSEQYAGITGAPPHPSVLDAFVSLESKGQRPFSEVGDGLLKGTISVDDATSIFGGIDPALRFFNNVADRRQLQAALDARTGAVADKVVGAGLRVQERKDREAARLRDKATQRVLTEARSVLAANPGMDDATAIGIAKQRVTLANGGGVGAAPTPAAAPPAAPVDRKALAEKLSADVNAGKITRDQAKAALQAAGTP